jgi:hypothetical protein
MLIHRLGMLTSMMIRSGLSCCAFSIASCPSTASTNVTIRLIEGKGPNARSHNFMIIDDQHTHLAQPETNPSIALLLKTRMNLSGLREGPCRPQRSGQKRGWR